MKKKTAKSNDINALMAQIQEQLAVLDRKLDAFMTKSLTELAQARVAHVPKPPQPVQYSSPTAPRPNEQRPARQMYAVVCFECGKDTEIPFKPSGDRPVYCQECFAKRKGIAPKVSAPKPQAFSIAPASTPAPTAETPSASKKKVTSKKTVAKKKVVAKKQPKRK
jgi:CxxC-x17-CxxC domain-containing protein